MRWPHWPSTHWVPFFLDINTILQGQKVYRNIELQENSCEITRSHKPLLVHKLDVPHVVRAENCHLNNPGRKKNINLCSAVTDEMLQTIRV